MRSSGGFNLLRPILFVFSLVLSIAIVPAQKLNGPIKVELFENLVAGKPMVLAADAKSTETYQERPSLLCARRLSFQAMRCLWIVPRHSF